MSTDPGASTISEVELARMGQIAHLLDTGKPAFRTGQRPQKSRSGQGTEFLEHRDYRPGEDTRHLDWRISARHGRHFVRTYHDELSSDWQVCLDVSASMHLFEDKWKLATQIANAFIFLLLHEHNRVGLIEFSDRIENLYPLGHGRTHYVHMADRLRSRQAKGAGETALHCVNPALKRGSHLVLISDFLTPDSMQFDLTRLRAPGRKIHAVQILSPEETEIAKNTTTVEDVESGQLSLIDSIAPRRADEKLKKLQQDLIAFCSKNGIKLTSCLSDDRWQAVVFRHAGLSTHD